jgi:hypothetical protein
MSLAIPGLASRQASNLDLRSMLARTSKGWGSAGRLVTVGVATNQHDDWKLENRTGTRLRQRLVTLVGPGKAAPHTTPKVIHAP